MSEKKKQDELDTTRRGFLKTAALTGAGIGAIAGATSVAGAEDKKEKAAEPASKVPRRKLGSTGEEIPILLVGAAMKFDEKYDKILHGAFREGVNYIDTALVYAGGQSHKTLAPFIKQVGREKLWITSKGPSTQRDRGGNLSTVQDFTRDIDTCLEQMQIDQMDLYFMHYIDSLSFLEPDFIKMGEALKKSGKTRYFGFSCHDGNVAKLLDKAAKVGGIDAIMFRYNFRQYGDLELNKAIDACKKAGIGLIAMKTQDSVPEDLEQVVGFKSKNFTLGQAKLKAVWADERIDAAVSHMDNTKKLRENVAAAKSPVQLSMHEIQQLRAISTATAHYACQGCRHHCEQHIEGEVKVADTLRFLMYYESYGEQTKARELYRELPAAARAAEGVDFARASQACPQGIDIAARMSKAQQVLSA